MSRNANAGSTRSKWSSENGFPTPAAGRKTFSKKNPHLRPATHFHWSALEFESVLCRDRNDPERDEKASALGRLLRHLDQLS
jgi:hypothetical protein